jgi:hypothetical protein
LSIFWAGLGSFPCMSHFIPIFFIAFAVHEYNYIDPLLKITIDKKMKLTKDRFSTWEDINDKDYEKEFDDELIIKVYPNESSIDIADYILSFC